MTRALVTRLPSQEILLRSTLIGLGIISLSCHSRHVCCVPIRGEKVVIRLAQVPSDTAAVPQHSKMVLVLLESVFLHSKSCHQWLVRRHREYDTKTLCLYKVGSTNVQLLNPCSMVRGLDTLLCLSLGPSNIAISR